MILERLSIVIGLVGLIFVAGIATGWAIWADGKVSFYQLNFWLTALVVDNHCTTFNRDNYFYYVRDDYTKEKIQIVLYRFRIWITVYCYKRLRRNLYWIR